MTTLTTIRRVLLPEDILNYIFDYLSHITDSGWIFKINRKGKLCIVARDSCMRIIDHVNFYKRHSTWFAGNINLLVDKGGANWDLQSVPAISQPYLLCNRETMNANIAQMFYYRSMCYQYQDADTGSQMVAYMDLRVNLNPDEVVFHQGCVYDDQGNSFVITGYGADANSTRIQVNPIGMIWDTVGDESIWNNPAEWDDNMWDAMHDVMNDLHDFENEEAEEDELGEDFDPDAHPLQMYM